MIVTEKHFGSVYSGFPQDAHYEAVQAEVGTTIFRWPGGYLAEERPEIYDITGAQVFDPTLLYSENSSRERYSLADATTHAQQNDQTLSVVIPTYRYEGDISQGEADLIEFLQNTSSIQEIHNHTIRLEIGNEYYASSSLSAEEYGIMAARFATVIDEFSSPLVDFKIIIQAGKSEADNIEILSHFSGSSMEKVDGVSFHMLPINLRNLYYANHQNETYLRLDALENILSAWQNAAFEASVISPKVVMSAWAVGEATSDAASVNLEYQDYGARGGVTSLALFTEAIHLGVQESAAWGVGESGFSSLGRVVDDQVQLTHSGTVLAELQNSIIGLSLSESSPPDFDWDRGFEFSKVAFTGLGRMVLYTANGEDLVSAATNLSNLNPSFSPETAAIVEAKRISTEYVDDYSPTGGAEDRLYEVPIVEDILDSSSELVLNDEWLSFQQNQEFQVQEITLSWLHQGSSADESLSGYAYGDWFDGGRGNDTLLGHGANDTLSGNDGEDWIHGGAGSDSLDGNNGHDIIFGDDQELSEWHLAVLGLDEFSYL